MPVDPASRLSQMATFNAEIAEVKGLERAQAQKRKREWENQLVQAAIDRSLSAHLNERSALESRIVWFWTNHFNVYALKAQAKPWLESLEFDVIAPRSLGLFRDLLLNASLHPAILMYLDNQQNRKNKINENLAREILELHTLGVDGGYTQQDVQQLALALTGIALAVSSRNNPPDTCESPRCVPVFPTGTSFYPGQHVQGPKILLGKTYNNPDGLEAIDMLADLAAHPATARHISRKLCQYWLDDTPGDVQIERISKVWQQTGGDLLAVSEAVLALWLGRNTANRRLKDPFRYVMDGLRILAPADSLAGNADARPVKPILRDLGMGHYMRISPDGYPLNASAWESSATLLLRLSAANKLVAAMPRIWPGSAAPRVVRDRFVNLQKRLSPDSRIALKSLESRPIEWLSMLLMTPEFMFE